MSKIRRWIKLNSVRGRTDSRLALADYARMPNNEVRREALHRAYYAVDQNLERLRALLGVPPMPLCDWLAGRVDTPLLVFLRAVDVIVDAGHEDGQKYRQR